MKSIKCYELPQLFRDVLERAIDPDSGEMTVAGLTELRLLTIAASDTSLNLACYIREIEMQSDNIKAVATATAERASKLLKQADISRTYLMDALDAAGLEKAKDDRITISVRYNPPSVNITSAEMIPEKYLRIIPEKREPDKTLLKTALNNEEDVPGCSLVQQRRIAIK